MPKIEPYDHDHENEVQLFAKANFRNRSVRFGIKTDDRRRHVYVIGKSGMGKTTLLENMILSDIHAGHGCCYIDPHGDTAQKILDYIPSHRINDVVYFNPADTEFPIGFNILEAVDPDKKHLVAAGLMAVFKKIWPDVWSARMEYILVNTILALLDVPGATLLGINRLYVDEEYRKRVVSLIQDPIVKTFWVKEFAGFSEKYRTEAVAPVQNKVGQFMSASIIRNIVAQVKSTIDMRDIMDNRKIFIVNLSKGLIGEENMNLLGGMLITRLQLAAMERVDIPEKDRQDFYLYVDEFQNFANESFATILSEARKYRLGLIMAHQYIEQLDEKVASAIFGNVGTMITFRVGGPDAEVLEKEFTPHFTPEDLIGLTKYDIYLRLLIDGVASQPFSATTLPPIAERTGATDKVIRVSRERYARSRKSIEENVIKWSGFGTGELKTEDELEEEEARPSAVSQPVKPEPVEALPTSTEPAAAIPFSMGGEDVEARIKELQASSPYVGEMVKPADGGGFGQKKKKEVKHEVPCSVCGEMQKLTFDPDWSKPWFCKNHLDVRNTPMARKLPSIAKLMGREEPDGKAGGGGNPAAARADASRARMAPPRTPGRLDMPDVAKLKPVEVVSDKSGPPLSLNQLKPRPAAPDKAKSNKPRIVISKGEDNAAEELLSAVVPARDKETEGAEQQKPVQPLSSPIVERELSGAEKAPSADSARGSRQAGDDRRGREGRGGKPEARKPRIVVGDDRDPASSGIRPDNRGRSQGGERPSPKNSVVRTEDRRPKPPKADLSGQPTAKSEEQTEKRVGAGVADVRVGETAQAKPEFVEKTMEQRLVDQVAEVKVGRVKETRDRTVADRPAPLTSPMVDQEIRPAEPKPALAAGSPSREAEAPRKEDGPKDPPDAGMPSVGGYDDTVPPGQPWQPGQVVKF